MSRPVVYGGPDHSRRFYWYCNDCKSYGYDERLSFVYVAGRQHQDIAHWQAAHA